MRRALPLRPMSRSDAAGRRSARRALARAALLLAVALVAPPPAAAQQTAPTGTRLDFRDAPLGDVIRSLAAAMGLTAITSEVPTDARITFSTATPVPVSELAALLEGILESRGLVAVVRGSVAQIYPSDKAPRTGQVRTGLDRFQNQTGVPTITSR